MVELTSAQFFEALINSYVNDGEPPKDPGKVFVTELAGCLRVAYFRRFKPLRFEGPQAIKVFIGRAIHESLSKVLAGSKEFRFIKRELRTEYPVKVGNEVVTVSGRVDVFAVSVYEVILEIKSVSEVPKEPYPDHVRQLKYYLALFNVDLGVLLYISRDGLLRTFVVRKDPKALKELEARARQLYYLLKYRKLPRPERGPQCYTCPYKWNCYSK